MKRILQIAGGIVLASIALALWQGFTTPTLREWCESHKLDTSNACMSIYMDDYQRRAEAQRLQERADALKREIEHPNHYLGALWTLDPDAPRVLGAEASQHIRCDQEEKHNEHKSLL